MTGYLPFTIFHDYLKFCGEKKMTGYLPFTSVSYSGQAVSTFLEPRFLHIKVCKSAKNT